MSETRIPTTRDKNNLILDIFFFNLEFLRAALDWASVFMSNGVEIMLKYGLDVDFMKF